jgi:hypothetical protein
MERSPPPKVVHKKEVVNEDQSVIDMYKYLGLTALPQQSPAKTVTKLDV